jgi:hypothetical protein
LSVYGPRCACCGETLKSVLTIDHVVPCGKAGRKGFTWRRVLTEGCPPAYQILCFNCNFSKGDRERCQHMDAGEKDSERAA